MRSGGSWRAIALATLMLLVVAPVAVVAGERTFTVTPLQVRSVHHGAKSLSGRLAQSDPSLLGRTDAKPVKVMVKFDYDSVAAYAGGIAGLSATSPQETGRSLRANPAAVRAYSRYLARQEKAITGAILARVPQAESYRSFRIAYGGVAMRLPANRIADLLSVPGVVAVQRDTLEQPLTDATPEFVGATDVWPSLGGSTRAGEGVIVGVLDTGAWPEHPSYADLGISHPGGTFGCEFGDGTDPELGDPFTCNDKLIGAYAFVDTYMTFIGAEEGEFCNNATGECSARDSDGHGTHTSSTAAGSPTDASVFGIDRGMVSGMAPGAHVIMYRVCLALGCFTSDSVAAVEQAILDGVDVINFSISGGADAYSSAGELAFLDAYAAGILVNASAGNSGPGPATANHAGPWVNTVGASTSDRHFISDLSLEADNGDLLTVEGVTITQGVSVPTPVILAENVPGYDDPLCADELPGNSANGFVVACSRGAVARNLKSYNVLQGGAEGMILYNPITLSLFTDNFWLPSIMIEGPSPAEEFLAFLDTHTGVTAEWDSGQATDVRGDVMAAFSSRGPLGDFLKPDVTAPGIQVLAGNTPEPRFAPADGLGPPGELFQSIAGTSMSSPHAAGVSALVKAAHPNWTPGQIKSALMTSSVQDVLEEDGATPTDPFDRGAGSIRANRAVDPTLTFNVAADDYFASADDELHRVDLNLPSINVLEMAGAITTTRTVKNVSGSKATFKAIVDAPDGASVTVTPSQFTLGNAQQQELAIKINGADLADGQYFGQIILRRVDGGAGDHTDAVMPVAFLVEPGAVFLEHDCNKMNLAVGQRTQCEATATNGVPQESTVRLTVSADGSEVKLIGSPPAGRGSGSANRIVATGTLSPSLAPEIESITEEGQGFGYFSMASLGVPAIPGTDIGDEGIINFDTSTFLFGDEEYNVVGMTSNGYAVVGGGDANDVDFVPQDIPDPARPNNVLAPFWTDLNPGDAGNLYAAEVTDGVSLWIVLEWEGVPTFGTTQLQTFQIWIEFTPGVEAINYEYGDLTGAGDASVGLVVGAENRDGSSAVQHGAVPVDGDELEVHTSPPTPGGSLSIFYKAQAKSAGDHAVTARMTSDHTRSAAIEKVVLHIT